MTFNPGPIVLVGSGETGASMRAVYDWLFSRLERPIRLAILETPAGFELNSAWVAGQIADFMQKRLQNFQPEIAIIPARQRGTPTSPDNPELLTPLLTANVIMMGPGSPTYAARQLHNSLAWHTLIARHWLGAALIFASAATVAVSARALPVYEIYKVGEELHWKTGLNLFQPYNLALVFIPHWNNSDGGANLDTSRCYMGQARFEQLIELLPPAVTLVGIDEHTALVIDPAAQRGRVMGVGQVTLLRAGREDCFATGDSFSLTELGPFQLPAPQTDLPPDIWESVRTAQDQASQLAPQKAMPPEAVLALVEQRAAARDRREWARADALRDEIEALGWRVLDSPEGPVLEPIE